MIKYNKKIKGGNNNCTSDLCVFSKDFSDTAKHCSICIDDINDIKSLCTLKPCNHVFHMKCMVDYLVASKKKTFSKIICPMCNENINCIKYNNNCIINNNEFYEQLNIIISENPDIQSQLFIDTMKKKEMQNKIKQKLDKINRAYEYTISILEKKRETTNLIDINIDETIATLLKQYKMIEYHLDNIINLPEFSIIYSTPFNNKLRIAFNNTTELLTTLQTEIIKWTKEYDARKKFLEERVSLYLSNQQHLENQLSKINLK